MLGRGLLMMAALLACGASGSFAQTEPAETVDREATRPAIEADSKPSPEVIRRLAAQSRLASRLLERLAKEPNAGDNIVVSPASVAMALSLLELGADEKLRAAIAQALGYEAPAAQGPAAAITRKKPSAKSPAQPGKATEDLKGLLQVIIDLDRDKDMQGVLSLANSIIFDPDAAPSDLALRGLRETGAKVAVENLSSEETLKGINDWVSAKTNGLIPTILETSPRNSGLVALNALYFKDKWKFPFEVSNTKPGRFQGVSGELDVAMMNMGRHLHRVQNSERFVGIELPYLHERFAMVLVTSKDKPARVGEFDTVAHWLDGEGFRPSQVEFAMPRFRLNGRAELLPALDAMGLKAGRASASALRGFSSVQQKISQITQKTFLQVDEAGTEAAAATAVLTVRSAARLARIAIDKPFLFALRDRVSGLILMAGYVGSPAAGPVAEVR
jgi:serine protease inhibitor